jgi:hypothetical protein
MSRAKPWFQFNSDAFLSATIGWPGDLKGFYCLVIVLMDARGGKLPDDLTMFARATGYEPRKCKRLLNDLQTLAKLRLNDGFWSFNPRLTGVQPTFAGSKPLKNNKPASHRHNSPRTTDNIEKKIESISSSLSSSQSAGARAGEMEAPASPAPPEQKQADKTPQLSEEERAAFVRKILGREVHPGRVERPELHHRLDGED